MDYKELDVWLHARKLVKTVYILTKFFHKERYGLTSQIRGCFVSVSSNIAEGCRIQSHKKTIYFSHISRGSLYEIETKLILANDLEYISSDINTILNEIERVKKLLNGFINYQKKL